MPLPPNEVPGPGDPVSDSPFLPPRIIHGSDTIPPQDIYYVNDYPYSHPAEIDYLCLGTIVLLVVVYQVVQRVVAKRIRSRLLTRINEKIGRARPLLVALAFFVILEVVLSIAVRSHPISRYRPDPVSLWKIHAAYTSDDGSDDFPINSQGLVNSELSLEKPEGVVRIFSLGDSRTLGGAGTLPPQTYPRVLEGELRRANEGVEIEVIQGALSGYSSYQGLLLFKNVGLKYEPDIVTVALGYQDKEPAWAADQDHMSDSYALSIARGLLYKSNLFLVIRKNLLNLVKYKRNKLDATRQVNRVRLEDFEENMSSIIELARAADCLVVFIEMPNNPYDSRLASLETQKYRAALRQIAERHAKSGDVHHLDLYDFFWPDHPDDGQETGAVGSAPDLERKSRKLFADDCHMRAVGHQAVARHLAAYFEENEMIERASER